jgi:hypothetical protein
MMEEIRRAAVNSINNEVESNSEEAERARLEEEYGKVYNTSELSREFTVKGFAAPLVVVQRKADGKHGSLLFQHRPRFYFSFQEA